MVVIWSFDWGMFMGWFLVCMMIEGILVVVCMMVCDVVGYLLVFDQGVVCNEVQLDCVFFYLSGVIELMVFVGEVIVGVVYGFEMLFVEWSVMVVLGEMMILEIVFECVWDVGVNGWYVGDNYFYLNYGGFYCFVLEDLVFDFEGEGVDIGWLLFVNLYNCFNEQDLLCWWCSDLLFIVFG